MMKRKFRRYSQDGCRRWFSVALLVSLAACGGKKEASSGQVLASVDGQEITIHQLNNELGKSGAAEASKQLLDGLVARQVLVNAAKKEKIDSDPAVLAELERTRDLVLAQAYVRSKIGMPARPTPSEIEGFYQQHPEWFAQRKQYEFAELVIGATSLSKELNDLMTGTRPIEEVAAWLETHRIQYTRLQVVKTSMDLPPAMLNSLKNMERGSLFIVREGPSAILASLQDVKPLPMSLAVATPQIQQYLMQQRQSQMTDQELNRLKAAAKIEYTDKGRALKDLAANAPAQDADTAPAAEKQTPADDAVSRGFR
jgi:EpsD family peptidyl-prolyl cis-trans isomerase